METIIKGIKYIFSDEITGRQEQASGILKYINKFSGIDKSNMSDLMFDDEFNTATLKLAAFMSLRPKLSENDLLDLSSVILFEIKYTCLMTYAESLKGLEDFAKKKTILKPLSMDSFESLAEKIPDPYPELVSKKK